MSKFGFNYDKSKKKIKTFPFVIHTLDGFTIDTDCDLDDVHVQKRNPYNGYHYTAIMALVDVSKNKNSYHRMQLLASDDEKRYENKCNDEKV